MKELVFQKNLFSLRNDDNTVRNFLKVRLEQSDPFAGQSRVYNVYLGNEIKRSPLIPWNPLGLKDSTTVDLASTILYKQLKITVARQNSKSMLSRLNKKCLF